MTVEEKLTILTDAAKYDVACTSSGGDRRGGRLGKTLPSGCCHTFSADGRCISLLKLLLTNVCIYDCQYCVNRTSHDLPRAMFTPRELADLTIDFYRRNYIEGLFLSSAVVRSPDYTTELLIRTLTLLREDYGFSGYIHAKAIPGADPLLTAQLGSSPPPGAWLSWPRTSGPRTSSSPWPRSGTASARPRPRGSGSATLLPLPRRASPPR